MTVTDSKREKARARWQKNKEDERKRKAPPPPPSIPKDLEEHILAERDRRASNDGAFWQWRWEHDETGKGKAFVADVWAAVTLLEWQLGVGKAKPAKVAEWLRDQGRDHGYTPATLRVLIYRARQRVSQMESPSPWTPSRPPRWQPIDLSRWPWPGA